MRVKGRELQLTNLKIVKQSEKDYLQTLSIPDLRWRYKRELEKQKYHMASYISRLIIIKKQGGEL